jgi:hypothetical protein
MSTMRPTLFQRPSRDLTAALRRRALSIEKAISMGFRSRL